MEILQELFSLQKHNRIEIIIHKIFDTITTHWPETFFVPDFRKHASRHLHINLETESRPTTEELIASIVDMGLS